MRRGLFIFIPLFLFFIVLCGGCTKDKDPSITDTEDKEVITDKERSLLIYMASNNTLYKYGYAGTNLSELLSAYNADDYKYGNIAVYYRGYDDDLPTLNIVNNNDSLTVVKRYEAHSSADVDVMREVIADFKSLFVSDEYGCILWSHGSGWLPSAFTGSVSSLASITSSYSMLTSSYINTQQSTDIEEEQDITNHPLYDLIRQVDYSPITRSFGQDGDDWLELSDLAEAIDDDSFDYIIFDACYMMAVEVIYALRNKADWMLGSPTEILGAGMQYNTMAKNLLSSGSISDKLISVAEDFKDKYSETTVSLVDLTKIDDFAAQFAEIVKDIPDMTTGVNSYSVQRYDRYTNHVIFDICDYISKISSEDSETITNMVDEIVEYKYSSSYFLYINMYNYNGVSSYIPFSSYSNLNAYYDQTDWSKDILNRE